MNDCDNCTELRAALADARQELQHAAEELKAAAEALREKPHNRDYAGTTASSTERSYQTTGYHRLNFGFGPPGVKA